MRDALEPGQEFDHNLHFGQHILAELVMRHLARLPGTEVLWNHTVKALAQDRRRGRASRSIPRTAKSRSRPTG